MKAILCVSNYSTNVGFAWTFIESLFREIAIFAQSRGQRTIVSYAGVASPPESLSGSPAAVVDLDFRLDTVAQIRRALRFVREHDIGTVYLTDRPSTALGYLLLRLAGVQCIIMHDHMSGDRSVPSGMRRLAKVLRARVPGMSADRVITVSDYVRRRQLTVNMMPPNRVTRIWNGLDMRRMDQVRAAAAPADIDLICCCRAAPEKGVDVLLRALALLHTRHGRTSVRLRYVGDGPQLEHLRTMAEELGVLPAVEFMGYRQDALALLCSGRIAVVPSRWQDALPLGVLEPMSLGIPVVATKVGGIPEMLRDEVDGLLVPAGDPDALAAALDRLLNDWDFAYACGQRGAARARADFAREQQIERLLRCFA